jgi:hypothetical protein
MQPSAHYTPVAALEEFTLQLLTTHLFTTHSANHHALCQKIGGRRPFLDQVADCRSARSSAPSKHENKRVTIDAPAKLRYLLSEWSSVSGSRTARRAPTSQIPYDCEARVGVAALCSSDEQCECDEHREPTTLGNLPAQTIPAQSKPVQPALPEEKRLSPSTAGCIASSVLVGSFKSDSAYCAPRERVVNNTEREFFSRVIARCIFARHFSFRMRENSLSRLAVRMR